MATRKFREGRPKLYHTDAEVRAAHSRNSQRVYYNNLGITREQRVADKLKKKQDNQIQIDIMRTLKKEVKESLKTISQDHLVKLKAYIQELSD